MSFIGIISSKKFFDNVKNIILEEIKEETINFVLINKKSIENIKNIKFKIIIIEENLEKYENYKKTLEKIFKSARYILINSDINNREIIKNIENKKNNNKKEITYGLNQKAIITISSISDTEILIYCQKKIKTLKGKGMEIEERKIINNKNTRLKIYEILIIYTIFTLYNINIMEQI